MADARFLHKKGMKGERVIALDHLPFRVWVQYQLSADDFGVMRASASVLRADNPRLEREPLKRVVGAMGIVLASGLLQTFAHQGADYWWQTDWQDFQQIRYPRETVEPMPSLELLQTATLRTLKHFKMRADRSRNDFSVIAEMIQIPASAGARETQTLTPTQAPAIRALELPEESARETDEPVSAIAPAWSNGPRPSSALAGSHRGCFYAPAACARGICVPRWLGDSWRQQYGDDTDTADRDIATIVATALAELPPRGGIGDTPKEFWQAVWKAAHGTHAPRTGASHTKGNLTLDAARRVVQARLAQSGRAS